MKNLNKYDIHIILGLWSNGHTVREIASIFSEQESTIRYHLEKNNVDTQDEPYQIVGKSYDDYLCDEELKVRKKQSKCNHPSFKCSLCGLYHDNVKCEERARIQYLESILIKNKISY